jgi:hypothetical protein
MSVLADSRFSDAQHLVSKGDNKTDEIKGSLVSDTHTRVVRFEAGADSFVIPFSAIRSLLYERSAKPRYAEGLLLAWPLLFTKSKKHFVTIQYSDPSGQGRFEIVRLDKNNVQTALQTLEADTGVRVERSEER